MRPHPTPRQFLGSALTTESPTDAYTMAKTLAWQQIRVKRKCYTEQSSNL